MLDRTDINPGASHPINMTDPLGLQEEGPDIDFDLYQEDIPAEQAALELLETEYNDTVDTLNVFIMVGQGSLKEFIAAAKTCKEEVEINNPGKSINVEIYEVNSGAEAINSMADFVIKYGQIDDFQYFGHASHGTGFDVNKEDMWADLYKTSHLDLLVKEEMFQLKDPPTLLSPLAKSIEDINPNWFAKGASITIHGCKAGTGDNSFAQQLADHLGVVVNASIKPVSFSTTPDKHTKPEGTFKVGQPIY
jgi:hypothetical protein